MPHLRQPPALRLALPQRAQCTRLRPALAQELDEAADERYGDGDPLPGGLRAVFTPGAGTTQHTLVREGQPDVAF